MRDDNDIDGMTNQFQRMHASHEHGEHRVGGFNEPKDYPSLQTDTGIYDERRLLILMMTLILA